MRAIILAAGVGRRLEPYTDDRPKCLIEIGGRSLLLRHLDILSTFPRVTGLDVVVGYRPDQIRHAVASWHRETVRPFPVNFHMNDAFRKGSILSLYTSKDVMMSEDALIMDADVLYPRELLRRILDSPHENAVLIDEQADQADEEMIICCRGDRAMHIARCRDPSTHGAWDHKGEGVGFFRIAKAYANELVAIIKGAIDEGLVNADYEDTLARFMKAFPCGYEQIGDLPWTEIDFSEDIVRAEREILPAIRAFESAA